MKLSPSIIMLTAGALISVTSNLASATENGELDAPLGLWGLDSAVVPPSGFYGQLITGRYRAEKAKDSNGDDVKFGLSIPPFGPLAGSISPRISVNAITLKLAFVSEEPLMGGRAGAYIGVPFLEKTRDINVSVTTPLPAPFQSAIGTAASQSASGKKSGIGDVEVAAFIGWKRDNLATAVALIADLPTGSFDKDSQVNLGLNYYSLRPMVSVAWSTESGFDLAAAAGYNFSTTNRKTDYKSGQYLQIEYSATYQWSGNFKAGLQGYCLHQTTDDTVTNGLAASLTNGNRGHVSALGPVASYQTNDLNTRIEFKYLKEMSARARSQGDLFLISLSHIF